MTESYRYDVLVAGGGIAGIAAALAAARNGARTCLIEKEYALGGLATLGLIIIYLPLDDGQGVQMSGGIAEELLRLSLVDGPGEIPSVWRGECSQQERSGIRYQVEYNAATMMINAEQLLLQEGVTLFYDARLAGVQTRDDRVSSVTVDTKLGPLVLSAQAFVDATGDADLIYFAGEPTVDDATNRRTGWYYSYNGQKVQLHQLTDPFYDPITPETLTYSGTSLNDISRHMVDMRAMIANHSRRLRELGQHAYPFMIPAFHGLRMTRRLDAPTVFDAQQHEGHFFPDAVGMIGNWRRPQGRYTLPLSALQAPLHNNLYAAGRCISARGDGWDLARVIPSCAVSGQAAGTAAALRAKENGGPELSSLQDTLVSQGVLLDPSLFLP